MRFMPAALALSVLAAVTASVGHSAPSLEMDQRAAALVSQGEAQLNAGNIDAAVDSYEAALVIEPGSPAIYLALGEATRRHGMQGKAIHYYRLALESDPQNILAISGEGAAMVEKGAVEKARRNLARLEGLCGSDCEATRRLSAAIAKGPPVKIVTAQAVTPAPVVGEN